MKAHHNTGSPISHTFCIITYTDGHIFVRNDGVYLQAHSSWNPLTFSNSLDYPRNTALILNQCTIRPRCISARDAWLPLHPLILDLPPRAVFCVHSTNASFWLQQSIAVWFACVIRIEERWFSGNYAIIKFVMHTFFHPGHLGGISYFNFSADISSFEIPNASPSDKFSSHSAQWEPYFSSPYFISVLYNVRSRSICFPPSFP